MGTMLRNGVAGLVVLGGLCASASAADGLSLPGDDIVWPRWQARLGLVNTEPAAAGPVVDAPGWPLRGASVLGDYYFVQTGGSTVSRLLPLGGLRATSGVVLGQGALVGPALLASTLAGERLALGRAATGHGAAPGGLQALPYVGVGYTGISLRGGLSLSADIGMIALNPGSAVRLGRAFGSGPALEDALRELRLSPVLQLGVSYTF